MTNNVAVQENVIFVDQNDKNAAKNKIGENSILRSGTVVYPKTTAGTYFQTGHNVLLRENITIGDHVTVGTNTVIDGNVVIGSFVKIESACYICTNVSIGSRVFIGPNVTFTNDKYPLKRRDEYVPTGPIIEDLVTIGGGVTILPGVTIGQGSFVAAGSLVTKDVPARKFATGSPATFSELPESLAEDNMAISWKSFIDEKN